LRGIKLKAILLVTMAVILVSGSIGAAYACFEVPHYAFCHPGQAELKIRDQDETWGDGVLGTWTASNMAPGDEFTFDGNLVGLKSQSAKKVNIGKVDITCNYNSWTLWQPHKMAKYMVITSCVYSYSYLHEQWQIDFLTGRLTRASGPGYGFVPANADWQIQDFDGDGRITFYDLKKKPLKNIPSFTNNEACFEMSVMFHQDAGNEFQGDIFNLTMFYTLTSW